MTTALVKHAVTLSVVSLMALLPPLFPSAAVASEWQITLIDAGHGGQHTALHFDQLSNGHAVYVDEATHSLNYAFWDRQLNRWFSMPVDSPTAGYSAMALDSKGRPHVSYIEYGTGRVKYAYWDGASWNRQVIHLTSRLVEYYTSIVLDANDYPIISYYEVLDAYSPDYSLRLRTVHFTGRTWETRTVDSTQGSGKFNFLGVSPSGQLSIAYADVKDENASLRYARWDGVAWQHELLVGGHQAYYCRSVAMVVDNANTPHITYADVANHQIRYATRHNDGWVFEVADSLIQEGYPDRNGIALDEQGEPYISYFDAGAGSLKVTHRAGNKWVSEVVDRDFSGFTSSIQISHGELFVIYFDSQSNSLRCARRFIDNKPGAMPQVK